MNQADLDDALSKLPVYCDAFAIEELSLDYNNIGDEGATELAEALKTNKFLTTVNLGDNKIGDEGAANFAEALKKNHEPDKVWESWWFADA